jgi:serine/threonine protein kinase
VSVYHEDALEPGSAVAEYTIESMLGHGAFGITYLAQDAALGSHVAIKEYLPQEIATRDTRGPAVIPQASHDAIRQYHWGLKNFVKEARALARFKHANIVRVVRFIEANGTAYVVMEYEQGKTLFQHLRESGQRLDERMLLRIMIPILNGLQAVHDAGLLHLDIKPENIYLRRDGSPMLIDFGSARQAMTQTSNARITLTHGYAPVEQYPDKGQLGPWSDVYAVGATMYRCVTGKRPDEALARYRAVLDYKVDPLKPAVKAGEGRCQPMLLECIDWAMQLHAKDRPQSARGLQDGLVGRGRPSTNDTASRTAALRASFQPKTDRVRLRRVIPLALGILLGLGAWYARADLKQLWLKHVAPVIASYAAAVTPTPRPQQPPPPRRERPRK